MKMESLIYIISFSSSFNSFFDLYLYYTWILGIDLIKENYFFTYFWIYFCNIVTYTTFFCVVSGWMVMGAALIARGYGFYDGG
jgi:hypothetical protein